MKILYVAIDIDLPGTHGGSTHVYEVAKNLAKRNKILVLCSLKIGQKIKEKINNFIVFRISPSIMKYPLLRRIAPYFCFFCAFKIARDFKPDIIYERASSFGLGAFLAKSLNKPLFLEVNDKKLSLFSCKEAEKIITTWKRLIPKKYWEKVVETTWAGNVKKFNPNINGTPLRKKYGIKNGEKVIGYVGGFYSWHGLEDIVSAAKFLSNLPIKFLMIGEGRNRSKIEEMVKRKKLDNFIFTGGIPYKQVEKYMAACDIFLAPYNPLVHPVLRRIGYFYTPIKIFEYMAMGRAIIATKVGTINRILRNNKTAILVKPGAPKELAKAIKTLIENKQLRKQLGKNARMEVIKKYTWENHCKFLESLFKSEIDKNRV